MNCPSCGVPLAPGNAFCMGCGAAVAVAPPPQARPNRAPLVAALLVTAAAVGVAIYFATKKIPAPAVASPTVRTVGLKPAFPAKPQISEASAVESAAGPDVAPSADDTDERFARAGEHFKAERYADAVKELDALIALNPVYAPAHALRGAALAPQSQFAESYLSFRRALNLEPDNADVRRMIDLFHQEESDQLSQACAAQGDLSGTAAHLLRLVAQSPDNAQRKAALNETLSRLKAKDPSTRPAAYDPARVQLPLPDGVTEIAQRTVLFGEVHAYYDPDSGVERDVPSILAGAAFRLARMEPGVVAISIYEGMEGASFRRYRLDLIWIRASAPEFADIVDRIEVTEGHSEIPQ